MSTSSNNAAAPGGDPAWREEAAAADCSIGGNEVACGVRDSPVSGGAVRVAGGDGDDVCVHPDATGFFRVVPWVRQFPVLGIAVEAFGPVFVFSLGSCYFLMKGVTENIVTFSRQPMLVDRFGIDATRYQRLAGISTMGTSIKAFIAVITDVFALFGYTKRWYMVGSCVMGFAFTLGYGLLPAKASSANVASGFIFLSVFARANVDLLSEGHYSRLIRRNTAAGPALVSWIWWMIMVGTIIASVIQGPLSDSNKMQVGVFVAAALHVVPCGIFIMNWYGEKPNRVERHEDAVRMFEDVAAARREHRATVRRDGGGDGRDTARRISAVPAAGEAGVAEAGAIRMEPLEGENDDDLIGFSNAVAVADDDDGDDDAMAFEEPDIVALCGGAVEVNREVFFRNWKIVCYSVVMTCSVITMACVTILGTTWDLLYACVAVSVVCCACAFLTLPRVIAKANVFTYFDFVLYISLPGVLDTFYVADAACVPGGPHFSYTFYNTIGAVIQNVAGIFGVAMFTYMFSHMRYQVVMGLTVTLRVVASIFDLVMVERWNLAIGIPDHAMYIFGDAIVYQLRTPRKGSTFRGGGVALFADTKRVAAARMDVNLRRSPYSKIEVCGAYVMLKKCVKPQVMGICSAYMRPDHNRFQRAASIEMIEPAFEKLRKAGADLVVGDLNCAHYKWSPHISAERNHCFSDNPNKRRGARILSMTMHTDWCVANDGSPTYPARGNRQHPTTPDIVLYRKHLRCSFAVYTGEEKGCRASDADLRSVSDHLPIFSQVQMDVDVDAKIGTRCRQIAWSAIRDWRTVRKTCKQLADEKYRWRPELNASAKVHYERVAAMFGDLLKKLKQGERVIKKKAFQWSRCVENARKNAMDVIRSNNGDVQHALRELRGKMVSQLNAAYVRAAIELTNPRKKNARWLKSVHQTCKPNRYVEPNILTANGRPMPAETQAQEFAELFAAKSKRATTKPAEENRKELENKACADRPPQMQRKDVNLDDILVTVDELKLAISKLRSKQAADTWGIKPILLKNLTREWYLRISKMMTAMLRDGFVPREWLRADITPVFKGDNKDPALATSYRPVAVTNLLCRVLEIIVKQRLLHGLRALDGEGRGLNEHQFGFTEGVSVEMAAGDIVGSLVESDKFVHNWNKPLHGTKSYSTLLVAVDFTDAFCRVTPEQVEVALRKKEAPEYIISWIRAFMTERKQRVFVGGRFSGHTKCEVGCPQGSIISPLLWTLVLDELLDELQDLETKMRAVRFNEKDFYSKRKRGGTKRKGAEEDATKKGSAEEDAPKEGQATETEEKGMKVDETKAKFIRAYEALRFEDGTEVKQAIPGNLQFLGPRMHFAAFADDLTIWAAGHTPQLAAAGVQLMLNCITRWADRSGIAVSTKTEGRWFRRGNKLSDLVLRKGIKLQLQGRTKITIPPLADKGENPPPPIRVLGLLLDSRLEFAPHAMMIAAFVDGVLLDVKRHAPLVAPSVLSIALRSAAMSKVLYLLPVVWPSASKAAQGLLNRAWYRICTAITRTLCKTKMEAVLIEAGVRSLDCESQMGLFRLVKRIWTLPLEQQYVGVYTATRPEETRRREVRHNVVDGKRANSWRADLPAVPEGVTVQRRRWPGFTALSHAEYMKAVSRCCFMTELVVNGAPVKKCARSAKPEEREANLRLLRQFNEQQLAASPAEVTVWTDAATPKEGSGGAFIITGLDTPLGGMLSLGTGASSYAVERTAIRKGLEAVLEYAREHPEEARGWRRVRVVTDSRSTLTSLEKGPDRQTSEELEKIWFLLASLPVPAVALVFVFSHTEEASAPSRGGERVEGPAKSVVMELAHVLMEIIEEKPANCNPLADRLAKAAVTTKATDPVWGADVIRPFLRAAEKKFDESEAVKGTLIYKAFGKWFWKLKGAISRLKNNPISQRTLLQLRTGACYQLGGYLHDVEDRCPHCGIPRTRASSVVLGRSVDAVIHLFQCTAFREKKLHLKGGFASLWTIPTDALKYFADYVKPRATENPKASQQNAPPTAAATAQTAPPTPDTTPLPPSKKSKKVEAANAA